MKSNQIFTELIVIGILGAACFFIGLNKKEPEPSTNYGEPEDSGWRWWLFIAVPLGVIVLLFVLAFVVEILSTQ